MTCITGFKASQRSYAICHHHYSSGLRCAALGGFFLEHGLKDFLNHLLSVPWQLSGL